MTTALYRISSNEVLKISLKGQNFSDRDSAVWGVLTDPVLPDGSEVRDTSGPDPGPLRVLGFAKIAIVGSNTVQNATQPEIDTFALGEVDDDNQLDADQAAVLLDGHPQFRKILKAMIKGILQEDDRVRGQWETFKTSVVAAGNLSDIKTAVAALPDLPARSMTQAKDFILGQISKDD